jgi:hypothetical protein
MSGELIHVDFQLRRRVLASEFERLQHIPESVRKAAQAIITYGIEIHGENNEAVEASYHEAEEAVGSLCEEDKDQAWNLALHEASIK